MSKVNNFISSSAISNIHHYEKRVYLLEGQDFNGQRTFCETGKSSPRRCQKLGELAKRLPRSKPCKKKSRRSSAAGYRHQATNR